MKIAGIQFWCSDDKEKNTEKACKMLEIAVEQGAKIVSFQELFNLPWFPGTRSDAAFSLAEDAEGPTIGRMRDEAKKHGVVLVLPFFEKHEGSFYNSCAVIDGDGSKAGLYRKVHIPDIPLWEEKFFFSPGNLGFPLFETCCGRIAVQISWDNLFPEVARIYALKGADILFAPTACAFKSQHIWQTAISANAIANGLFAMRINRAGSEENLDFYGMSFCVNPEGELIGGPTGRNDAVLLTDANIDGLAQTRREWPIMKERRPDLYREILSSRGSDLSSRKP